MGVAVVGPDGFNAHSKLIDKWYLLTGDDRKTLMASHLDTGGREIMYEQQRNAHDSGSNQTGPNVQDHCHAAHAAQRMTMLRAREVAAKSTCARR